MAPLCFLLRGRPLGQVTGLLLNDIILVKVKLKHVVLKIGQGFVSQSMNCWYFSTTAFLQAIECSRYYDLDFFGQRVWITLGFLVTFVFSAERTDDDGL